VEPQAPQRTLRQSGLAGVVVGRGDDFLAKLETSEHPPEVKQAVRNVHHRREMLESRARREMAVMRRMPASVRPMARSRGEHGRAPRRAAARRAGGRRSGTDPGGSDSDGPGEAGLNLTALWRIYERLITSLVGLVLARFASFRTRALRETVA
jgi:hypothetical protein